MFVEKNSFKTLEDLSDQELRLMYNTFMLFLVDAAKGGFTKSGVISDNLSEITKLTGMSIPDVRSSYEVIQNDTNQLNFGIGERNKVGFNQPK